MPFYSISGEMIIQNKSQEFGFEKDKLQWENDKDKVIGIKRYKWFIRNGKVFWVCVLSSFTLIDLNSPPS